MIRKAYLVNYSEGSYDTFYINKDRVYFSKEKALARCQELDKLHEHKESMFVQNYDEYGNLIKLPDEDVLKTYWNCKYEADTYRNEHPEEFSDPDDVLKTEYKNDKKRWKEIWDLNEKRYTAILYDIVKKYYPDWTDDIVIKAVEIEEYNEFLAHQEYGEAAIDEIEVDIDE